MDSTYIFGNGLSMASDPEHYALPNLTKYVVERLDQITAADGIPLSSHVVKIIDELTPGSFIGSLDDIQTFEDLAGPLERLTASIQHVGALAAIGSDDQTTRAILQLSDFATRLYNQVVGIVLGLVTQHPTALGHADAVPGVARHLVHVAKQQRDLDVFVLNYDALLDSALLEIYEGSATGFQLTDEFDGRKAFTIDFGEERLSAIGFRDEQYHSYPRLRLFHLHGAATWLREGASIYKARRLQRLRDAGVFERWAVDGHSDVSPVLVLGDRKDRLVAKAPFDDQYAELRSSVAQADRVVIAGYSFGDIPLNAAVRASLAEEAEVVIINPDIALEPTIVDALAIRKQSLTFIEDVLPSGLDAL